MKREDVLGYLDSLEKGESIDPTHRWKEFYNLFEITVTRFFKWFYHPDVDADDRPKSAIVAGLKIVKPKGEKGLSSRREVC